MLSKNVLFIYDKVFKDEVESFGLKNNLYFPEIFNLTNHLHPIFIEEFIPKYDLNNEVFIRLSVDNFHYFYSFEEICFERLQSIYLLFKKTHNIDLLNTENVFNLSKRENIPSKDVFDVVYFLRNRKIFLIQNCSKLHSFEEEFGNFEDYIKQLNYIALLFKNKLLTDIQKLSLFNVVSSNNQLIERFFNNNFIKLEEVFNSKHLLPFDCFLKSSSCLKLLTHKLVLKDSDIGEEINNLFRNYSNNSFEWFNFLNLFKKFIYKENYLVLSPVKDLNKTKEYRLIVNINNKIVTASQYAVDGVYHSKNIDEDLCLIDRFQKFIKPFSFFKAFTKQKLKFIIVDLIVSEEEIFVLELNNIECSDFYDCDYLKLF